MEKRKIVLIAMVLMMILSGCVDSKPAPTQMTLDPTRTTAAALTSTAEPTATQTASLTPTKTATITLTPTMIKKSKEEVDTWLLEKIFEPECELPCFWGSVPGETSWEDVVEEISPYADKVKYGDAQNGGYYYAFYFYSPPEIITEGIFSMGITFEGKRIKYYSVGNLGNVPFYSLPAVLSQYGPPGEIWVEAFSGYANDDRSPRPSTMYILYPELNILLTYSSPPGIVENGIVKNCIEWGPRLEIWAPGELPDMKTFDERFVYIYYSSLHVEEALGMDVNTFYETYKGEPGDVCFETPADLWTWGESETDQ